MVDAITPGTRGILDVHAAGLDFRGARWQCHRCTVWFPTESAWAVRAFVDGLPLVTIVCPSCAVHYRNPPPVTIDLTATDGRSRNGAEDVVVDEIVGAAQEAARRRLNPTVPNIALRKSDVRRIASSHGATPREAYDRLLARGLLVR